MSNHKANPAQSCMLSCRIIENYDPWNRIAEIFSQCTLGKLKTDFWDMFKSAVLDDEVYPERNDISSATCLYEHMSDLITAQYLVAKDKGFPIQLEQAPIAFLAKRRHKALPLDTVKAISSAYEPYEVRDEMWQMFQSAIAMKGHDLTKDGRRNMIAVFEHMTDLVYAAYVIAEENR